MMEVREQIEETRRKQMKTENIGVVRRYVVMGDELLGLLGSFRLLRLLGLSGERERWGYF